MKNRFNLMENRQMDKSRQMDKKSSNGQKSSNIDQNGPDFPDFSTCESPTMKLNKIDKTIYWCLPI